MDKAYDSEVYTKDGNLKKRAPKQHLCLYCNTKQNTKETTKVKLPGIVFLQCGSCNGTLSVNPAYEKWMEIRRKNKA